MVRATAEGYSRVPPIGELTRIEQVHLDRLEHQGIFTTGLLLEVSETPTRRQLLADQVRADTNDVLGWRDEALMLNLASFGPDDHQLLMQAGFDGLHEILSVDLDTFRSRLQRAALELNREMPPELTISGWWEQARTLED
jgi:DNA-directed RNA polymerase specialized sigma24 family protein